MASPQDFDLLEKRIKSTAIQSFILSVLALLFGLALLAASASAAVQRQYQATAGMLVMAAISMFAAWSMLQNGRSLWPPRSSKIYTELSGDARQVSWAHPVVGKSNGVRVHYIDGEQLTLEANRQDSERLIRLIQQQAPHAILGYGQPQQKLYHDLVKARKSAAQARS